VVRFLDREAMPSPVIAPKGSPPNAFSETRNTAKETFVAAAATDTITQQTNAIPDKVGGHLPLINELSVALKPERFFQAHFEP
jgi:hypothetical protein